MEKWHIYLGGVLRNRRRKRSNWMRAKDMGEFCNWPVNGSTPRLAGGGGGKYNFQPQKYRSAPSLWGRGEKQLWPCPASVRKHSKSIILLLNRALKGENTVFGGPSITWLVRRTCGSEFYGQTSANWMPCARYLQCRFHGIHFTVNEKRLDLNASCLHNISIKHAIR